MFPFIWFSLFDRNKKREGPQGRTGRGLRPPLAGFSAGTGTSEKFEEAKARKRKTAAGESDEESEDDDGTDEESSATSADITVQEAAASGAGKPNLVRPPTSSFFTAP